MAYLRTSLVDGRSGGLGADLPDVSKLPTGSSVTQADVDPATFLTAQVNRFASDKKKLVDAAFPLPKDGMLDPKVALAAVLIYQSWGMDTSATGDRAGLDIVRRAGQGLGDPSSFVAANMSEVSQVVANWANSLGLPDADYGSFSVLGTPVKSLVIPALLGLGILLFLRRRYA